MVGDGGGVSPSELTFVATGSWTVGGGVAPSEFHWLSQLLAQVALPIELVGIFSL